MATMSYAMLRQPGLGAVTIPSTGRPPPIPFGKGVYVRDDHADDAPAFVRSLGGRVAVVNVRHPSTVRACVAAGLDTWVFGLPEQFRPGNWRASADACEVLARATGAPGVWIDLEPSRDHPWSDAQIDEVTAWAAAALRRGTGVVITMYDSMRRRAAVQRMGRVLGPLGGVVSPQAYDHQLDAGLDYAAGVYSAWAQLGFAAVLLSGGSISAPGRAFNQSRAVAVTKHYRSDWHGNIFWYERAPSGPYLAAIQSYQVGPGALNMAPWMVGGVLVAAAAAFAVYAYRRRQRRAA
jgi:hypothetical protein